MGVLIIGGGGMIGQKLAQALADPDAVLFDMAFPADGAPGRQVTGSVTDATVWPGLLEPRPAVIYLLAAVVSGEAEQDYDKGWAVNMASMWTMLEAIRAMSDYCPRIVFSSSIAVFGGPFPDKIGDEFLSAPQTSYGAQKATCELMLSDASRKGFVDGISIRLPTICVRPGKPNKAASGFFSNIIREPLAGQEAVLPVADTVRHWHASPRSAVGFLRHAAGLDTAHLAGRRALNMPGFSCTVSEQIAALERVAGGEAVKLIKREPDPEIMKIVDFWPRDFDPTRAVSLGFQAETDFDQIIQAHTEDELT